MTDKKYDGNGGEVKRWAFDPLKMPTGEVLQYRLSSTGEWVRYDDHAAALAEAKEEILRLTGESIGRREQLVSVEKERREEWTRAENAESELARAEKLAEAAKAVIERGWEETDAAGGRTWACEGVLVDALYESMIAFRSPEEKTNG